MSDCEDDYSDEERVFNFFDKNRDRYFTVNKLSRELNINPESLRDFLNAIVDTRRTNLTRAYHKFIYSLKVEEPTKHNRYVKAFTPLKVVKNERTKELYPDGIFFKTVGEQQLPKTILDRKLK